MQFSNFAKFGKFLVDKFKKKNMLEKKFCSNIVPSARTGSHFFLQPAQTQF